MKHEDIQTILDQWSTEHGVSFVSRSSGQRSVDTISRDALYELIQLAARTVDPSTETEQQRLIRLAQLPRKCPSCGCTKFTGSGIRTSDSHSAWQDTDGTWYDGPANESITLQCSADCGWHRKVNKIRGKVVAVVDHVPSDPDTPAIPPSA